ncbi:unnamed protein product [Nezara viridula]|uniref:Uncharacterized protein n=1 Tax=Nezara viridula TaxID=85310 RepID=A0A9P0GZT2_NEZVI|nr:unnamed protein product [Nezara viridula]
MERKTDPCLQERSLPPDLTTPGQPMTCPRFLQIQEERVRATQRPLQPIVAFLRFKVHTIQLKIIWVAISVLRACACSHPLLAFPSASAAPFSVKEGDLSHASSTEIDFADGTRLISQIKLTYRPDAMQALFRSLQLDVKNIILLFVELTHF